ncbi:DUF1642 domain-containing protein [Lactococcus cremoris]|uniref:DUF1642 domain-containing protein n=2 Tax=Lactococcus lactis subsp. cremoris TaxID=1359 RepID=UPI0021D15A36|nr:DUF1642 domain-containing protein [Lactococcus cremoris]WJQ76238.1 DUF1642 domain-containing protein [Lactococcus cremoris]
MTKFEEEVTRPDNGPITELNNNMQEVFSQYRKMREYADYLEYELKQKDEHILKLENENSFMRDERTTFDSNGMAVEPKLQLQTLPVVPECVAEYIERCKRSDCGLIWAIRPDRDANDNSEEVYDWLFPNGVKLPNGMYPNPYEPDNLVRPDKENQIKFLRAWLDGYTVEKPQLFYIDLPKVFGLSDSTSDSTFVSKAESGIISEFTKGKDYALKLTEQEIKSIDERYWQFAVPVEVQE